MKNEITSYGGNLRVVATRGEIARVAKQLAAVEHLLSKLMLELPLEIAAAPTAEHLALLAKLPSCIARLRFLQFCCWVSAQSYFTTEGQLRNLMHELLPGVTAAAAGHLAPKPAARSKFWVRQVGPSATVNAPSSIRVMQQRLLATADLANGTIRIESWVEGGRRHFIVYLPGTQDWSPIVGRNPINLPSNFQAFAGLNADSLTALRLALSKVGATTGDEIIMVAHSQGGLVAANLAQHPSGFNVSSILSFGAPMVGVGALAGTAVLALENRTDAVPLLAGKANPLTANWVTVQGSTNQLGVAAHNLSGYGPTATAVDKSSKKSVAAARRKLLAKLKAKRVKVQLVKVARKAS